MVKRNGYIDVVKFIFAIIVIEFHLRTGWFEGGRLVVEGFFMISGYLMMTSIEKNKFPQDPIGISTVRFIGNKFKALFPYLLPAILIAYPISCISINRTLNASARIFALTIFDLFPLNLAGFDGNYPVGISWYLSGMFLALAILYPFCKKYKSNFTLTVCPLLAVLSYGWISHEFGDLAVTDGYAKGMFLCAGLIRSIGGSALGCLIFEITKRFRGKTVKTSWRITFTFFELFAWWYSFYVMHYHPGSKYDFVVIFGIFALLTIGIGGLSFSSVVFSGKWTKIFGTWSLLLVLNHARLAICLRLMLGEDYIHTNQIWIFFGSVVLSSFVCWIAAKGIQKIMKKISSKSIWKD